MALIQDADPARPRATRSRRRPQARDDRLRGRSVIVTVRPPSALPFLGDALRTATAPPRPARGRDDGLLAGSSPLRRVRDGAARRNPPRPDRRRSGTARRGRVTGAAVAHAATPTARRPPRACRCSATPESKAHRHAARALPTRSRRRRRAAASRPGDPESPMPSTGRRRRTVRRSPMRSCSRPMPRGCRSGLPAPASCALGARGAALALRVAADPRAADASSCLGRRRRRPPAVHARGRDDAAAPAASPPASSAHGLQATACGRLAWLPLEPEPTGARHPGSPLPARSRRRRSCSPSPGRATRRSSHCSRSPTSRSPSCRPAPIRRCGSSRCATLPPRARRDRRRRSARPAALGGDGRARPPALARWRMTRERRPSASVRDARGQVAVLLVGGLLAVGAGALVLGASRAGSAAATRAQRAADLAALGGARAMHDAYDRLFEPALIARPAEPAPSRRRTATSRSAAPPPRGSRAANGGAGAQVAFPDGDTIAPVRVRVAVERRIDDRRARDPRRGDGRGRARAARGRAARPRSASGGGYDGPLAYRQGKPMRPDVAQAFDRMAAAARRDGVDAGDQRALPLGRRAGGAVRPPPGPEVGRAAGQVAAPQRHRARPRAARRPTPGSRRTRAASTSCSATRGSPGISAMC